MAKVLNDGYHEDADTVYEGIELLFDRSVKKGIISERDRIVIEKFKTKSEQSCSPARVKSIANNLVNARRFFRVDYVDVDDDEFEAALSRITRGKKLTRSYGGVGAPFSRNYIVQLHSAVIRFYKWMVGKNLTKVTEKTLSETKVGKPDLYTKTENDVLTSEEVEAIINAAKTPMYKAYFSMLYETGARSVEMANLKWGDLIFESWGIRVQITDTKTDKMRSVPCITYAKYLYEWANNYPDGEPNGDKFVFLSCRKKPIRYNTIVLSLRRIVKRAGIQKKVSLHRFRHSRITHVLREGMNETVAKKAFWGNLDSHMIATYGHLTNRDVENECMRIAGVEIPEHKDSAPKPVTCPTCLKLHPPGTRYCDECGTPLSEDAKKKKMSAEEYADSEMAKFTAEDFIAYREIVAKQKEINSDLNLLKAKMKIGEKMKMGLK